MKCIAKEAKTGKMQITALCTHGRKPKGQTKTSHLKTNTQYEQKTQYGTTALSDCSWESEQHQKQGDRKQLHVMMINANH